MKLEEHIPNADQKLKDLILSIGDFSTEVRTGFMTRQGKTDTKNIYGEKQAQMDKWADKVLVNRLLGLDSVASVSSEERPDVVKGNPDGEFSIVMDPLDGSSLLDVNFAVGTIIGIFRNPDPFLAGKDMVAAMYILYGPLTTLTYTVGMGVHEFVLGKDETYQSNHLDISIPRGKIYSPGGLRKDWNLNHIKYIEKLEEEGYKLRFSGCFCADVHQILFKGGVFTYPALKDRPNGKLRLLIEGMPMGFIVQNAGGRISNGNKDLLDIKPDRVDIRTPIYVGGKGEIELIEKINAGKEFIK
jgi:fructose-1,6-bisphosphatase I